MIKYYISLIYYIGDRVGSKEATAMNNTLVKVVVELSLADVVRLKQKHAQIIDSLPFRVAVGRNIWYVSEAIYKMILNILKK